MDGKKLYTVLKYEDAELVTADGKNKKATTGTVNRYVNKFGSSGKAAKEHYADTELTTYEYGLWGRPVSAASTEDDTNNITGKNPYRYSGYYYDSETGFYYLTARYYDPQIRRFISADSMNALMIATTDVTCKNLFVYAENNPVTNKDSSGGFVETIFDVVSLASSIVEVCKNPTDPLAWAGAVGDAIDLIPCVTGVGEIIRGAKAAAIVAGAVSAATDVAKVGKKAGNTFEAAEAVAKSAKKADVLADNRKAGKVFEQQEFAKFSSVNSNAVEQITIKTNSGVRTRVDAIGIDSDGNVVISEFKSSATAPFTNNQKIAFPEIYESGGVVVGKGKGIFTGGYQIPAGTQVNVVRP